MEVEDTLWIIFSYLDPKALINCSQVCWKWNQISEDPQLWKQLVEKKTEGYNSRRKLTKQKEVLIEFDQYLGENYHFEVDYDRKYSWKEVYMILSKIHYYQFESPIMLYSRGFDHQIYGEDILTNGYSNDPKLEKNLTEEEKKELESKLFYKISHAISSQCSDIYSIFKYCRVFDLKHKILSCMIDLFRIKNENNKTVPLLKTILISKQKLTSDELDSATYFLLGQFSDGIAENGCEIYDQNCKYESASLWWFYNKRDHPFYLKLVYTTDEKMRYKQALNFAEERYTSKRKNN
ncbi:hypothetical protein M0811_11155 [Anaeramoeba ignava]|uniref:F-box domain-containing protein n=1 Tax=Anaeramoeba ignava TaxID=1746090 RepID=A0A9Q0LCE7_ANAIG|nr:hypothetical protein M0811_11155 [Anaeramoeba ignava]